MCGEETEESIEWACIFVLAEAETEDDRIKSTNKIEKWKYKKMKLFSCSG